MGAIPEKATSAKPEATWTDPGAKTQFITSQRTENTDPAANELVGFFLSHTNCISEA